MIFNSCKNNDPLDIKNYIGRQKHGIYLNNNLLKCNKKVKVGPNIGVETCTHFFLWSNNLTKDISVAYVNAHLSKDLCANDLFG